MTEMNKAKDGSIILHTGLVELNSGAVEVPWGISRQEWVEIMKYRKQNIRASLLFSILLIVPLVVYVWMSIA